MEHFEFPLVRTCTLDWESLCSDITVNPVVVASLDHLFERQGAVHDIGHNCGNNSLSGIRQPASFLAEKLLEHVPPRSGLLAVQLSEEILKYSARNSSFFIDNLVE